MISAHHISFSYGRDALFRDLNFTVEPGECLVLTGPNGSGKSTLISLLAGILKPQEGEIRAQGLRSLIPQGSALFEDMSVQDNLLFFAGVRKVSVPETLPFDLEPYRHKKLADLSGGSKKRLSIACALLGDPRVLLFDEPCAGLDHPNRDNLIDWIKQLKEQGRSIVYAGHDPQEYVSFFDRVLFLGAQAPVLREAEDFASSSLDISSTVAEIEMLYRSMCHKKETR